VGDRAEWWQGGELLGCTPKQLCSHGWDLLRIGKAASGGVFFHEALRMDQTLPEPWWGLVRCLGAQGRAAEAEAAHAEYQRAVALGWDGGPLKGPLLVGEPAPTELVPDPCSYGIGDVIQSVRFLEAAAERAGGPVILRCRKSLHGLLSTVPGVGGLADYTEPEPACGARVQLGGLTGCMRGAVSWTVPYLSAEEGRVGRWRKELAGPGLKVAIHWEQAAVDLPSEEWGGRAHPACRSVPLEAFAPLAQVPGVRLLALQVGPGREQLQGIDFPVEDLAGRPDFDAGGFLDTAAVLKACDLLICIDSAPAHVAGALGVPTWLLLPRMAYAHWTRGSPAPGRTLLYPNVVMFRVGTDAEDWAGLLGLVARWLAKWPGDRE
jgi:hypothetical protein